MELISYYQIKAVVVFFGTNLIVVYLMVLKECILMDNRALFPVWPSGTYGLPKAAFGCPEWKGEVWVEGFLVQDMENESPHKSEVSASFHMEAKLSKEKDINRTFCIKKHPGTFKRIWPEGTYCIYKKYDCPTKMQAGSIGWDDENTNNISERNSNYYLPAGTYGPNTLIHYCCQDEGYWFNSIELPVDRPFYLLPHKSPNCQRVKWALSSLEYIVYDTENNNNDDEFSGSHVFTNKVKSLPKMYYCYYQGCRQKLHGDSGSFSLSNVSDIYPDFQYCSWLITVNKTLLVSLSFTSIQVHNCDENYILYIYDGSNETYPLLASYCNISAAEAKKVNSTANNLYVVFKSGNTSLNPGINLKFYANYVTSKRIPHLTSKPKPNNQSNHNFPVKYIIISAGIVGTTIITAIIVICFIRLRKIRDGQHSKREETLRVNYESQLTSGVDANVRGGVYSFQANGNNRDDSYVETLEVIADSFNKSSNCEVSDAVITNEDDGYVISAEVTSEMSRNKHHYEVLGVSRRKDDEHKYKSLVRISDVDGSEENYDYVIPAETRLELTP